MKSKRLLSLAMAAVMSVSALGYCASIRTPVGVVASAEVSYTGESKVEMPDLQAKVIYTDEDWKNKKIARFFPQTVTIGGNDYTLCDYDGKTDYPSGVHLKKDQLSGWKYKYTDDSSNTTTKKLSDVVENNLITLTYSVKFGDLGLKKPSDTPRYTFYGWKLVENKADFTDPVATQTDVANSTEAEKVCLTDSKYAKLKTNSEGKHVGIFQTVVHIANTDEEIMDAIAQREKEAAEKKAATKETNKRNDYVAGKQSKWNGWDNVIDNTTTPPQQKSWTLANDTNNTGKNGVVYIPPEGKGIYSASDVKTLFDICGVTDVEKAFLFEINMPNGYQLIDGKNVVVKIDMDKSGINANTDGYNVYLYHMVNGKAKRIRKIGWRMYYVVFASNSFSPYVLVLTPKDQKRGVASTGEVLYANPPTGEGDVVPVAMLAATALCTSCLLTVRKRRELEV